jgi:hypothetical protein
LGILHQAIEAYASRQSQGTKTEWSKVQGRFIDFGLRTTSDELVSLAARAITRNYSSALGEKSAAEIFEFLREGRPGIDAAVSSNLGACWPLHPSTSLLLSSLTRKSFAQSQRSFFGFLSSIEPHGFREFLSNTSFSEEASFKPADLFDYIHTNLESFFSDSRYSKKWATTLEAIGRVEARHSALHLSVFKTISLFDLLREPSSLQASEACLSVIFQESGQRLSAVLQDLSALKVITFRKYLGTWALFEGSDFDVEAAVSLASEMIGGTLHGQGLVADFPPVVAKQHLSRTGCMRWINRTILDAQSYQGGSLPSVVNGAVATACVITGSSQDEIRSVSSSLLRASGELDPAHHNIIWGIPLTDTTRELAITLQEEFRRLCALERVWLDRPELEGDDVARREVRAQLENSRSAFEVKSEELCRSALWFCPDLGLVQPTEFSSLSKLASYVADRAYSLALPIRNELLNRESASSPAMKALKELMFAMLEAEPFEGLRFEGWPAERGIFASVIESTGHHVREGDVWRFECSTERQDEFGRFWAATDELLKADKAVQLTELYDFWESPPYGVRRGLAPLLVWLYLLSRKQDVVFYFDGVFQPKLLPINAEEILRRPKEFALRYLQVADEEVALLTELSERFAAKSGRLIPDDPLSVARAVVYQFRALPNWTRRTMLLEASDRDIRTQVLRASDPNQLLFVILPEFFKTTDPQLISERLLECLSTLESFLPRHVDDIWATFMSALEVPDDSFESLNRLLSRLSSFEDELPTPGLRLMKQRLLAIGVDSSVDLVSQRFGLICASIGKTDKDFVDHDIGMAKAALCQWALEFRKFELHRHLNSQSRDRTAVTFGYGLPGEGSSLFMFDVGVDDVAESDLFVERFADSLSGLSTSQKVACLVKYAAQLKKEIEHE